MAVKKGRSQARRNSGNSGGLPGWAWMVLGIVVTLLVVLAAPRLLKSDGDDGFYRPRANPDATPAPATSAADEDAALPAPVAPAEAEPSDPDYDFYTLLPGQEVPMTDAELEASAQAERERERRQAQQREQDAAALAEPDAPLPTPSSAESASQPATTAAAAAPADTTARYLLQAGSFSASGDAEALKARIALLGLGARVESAQVDGRTMYRVRMGPYGTASELADAKGKLESGGLDPLAIKVQ